MQHVMAHVATTHVAPTGQGVVETFGQLADVSYWDHDVEEFRRYRFPPVFLEKGNASTIHSAVESACGSLSIENLVELSERTVVLYDETVDCGKPNLRRRGFVSFKTRACPDLLYQRSLGCTVHLLNRLVTKVIGESRTVGDVHAVQYVLRIASKRNSLIRALHLLVCDELVVVHAAPPPEYLAHTSAVISHTIARTVEHVRGRVDNGFAVSPAKNKKPFASRQKLLQFLNGDIRALTVTHYCNGLILSFAPRG
jgi:hypothetical protein